MRYIIDDEIMFRADELQAAKNYYYSDNKIDDYFIEKNEDIKNAESLEDIVNAYNSLTDNYYSGSPLRIYDDVAKMYIKC